MYQVVNPQLTTVLHECDTLAEAYALASFLTGENDPILQEDRRTWTNRESNVAIWQMNGTPRIKYDDTAMFRYYGVTVASLTRNAPPMIPDSGAN